MVAAGPAFAEKVKMLKYGQIGTLLKLAREKADSDPAMLRWLIEKLARRLFF